jgi:hypothetical protein
MQRPGILGTPPPARMIMRKAGQRQPNVRPYSLGRPRSRIFVIVSRPIQLREGAAPIRRVLIFDDHPATLRLLNDVDLAQRRKDKLALVQFSALIILLVLVIFWPLL